MPKQLSLFVGRFQPLHDGHRWLFSQVEGPLLILVRDCGVNEDNPMPAIKVARIMREEYPFPNVVLVIPDICSINYGRDVGYDVVEWTPPDAIGAISATEIRREG